LIRHTELVATLGFQAGVPRGTLHYSIRSKLALTELIVGQPEATAATA
jgi:hypothetical protein